MRVTNENYDEYLAINNCKHQMTFPLWKEDALSVICTHGVDTKGLAPYQYAPKCKECIGKECPIILALKE